MCMQRNKHACWNNIVHFCIKELMGVEATGIGVQNFNLANTSKKVKDSEKVLMTICKCPGFLT